MVRVSCKCPNKKVLITYKTNVPCLMRQNSGVTGDVRIQVNVIEVDVNFVEEPVRNLLFRFQNFFKSVNLFVKQLQSLI